MNIELNSKYKGKIYKFNLNLRNRITVIYDWNDLERDIFKNALNISKEDIISYCNNNIKILRLLLNNDSKRFNFTKHLIIVSNSENLLREVPELLDCINYDRDNYYLVFIRQTSIPIAASPNNMAKLKFNKETNTFCVEYVYEEGVWA